MALSGMGLMYINNIGSIVLALIPDKSGSQAATEKQALMVSLISLFNCLGRIATGIISDKAQVHYGTQRLWFLISAGIMMLVAQFMGAFVVTTIPALIVCTCILGFGYGSLFSSTPAIVSKWFGVLRFGENWGYYQVGPAMGGYLWNIVFGMWMDHQRVDHGDNGECKSVLCFSGVFL
eukprot:jgi/Hompol1/177/HPOL_001010-RA